MSMYQVKFDCVAERKRSKLGFKNSAISSLLIDELRKKNISFGDFILEIEKDNKVFMFLGDIKDNHINVFDIISNIIKVKQK